MESNVTVINETGRRLHFFLLYRWASPSIVHSLRIAVRELMLLRHYFGCWWTGDKSDHNHKRVKEIMMQRAAHQQQHPQTPPKGKGNGEKNEAEIAKFLLSLKNRSPTPEPPSLVHSNSDDSSRCNSHHHHPPPHHAHPPRQPPPGMKAPYRSYHYPPYGGYQHPDQPRYLDQHHQPSHGGPTTPAVSSLSSCTDNIVWENLLCNSPLVFVKDRDLVPDALFVAIAQMKPCRLSMADRVGCYKSRELGFVGMCCKHCGGQPGFGRYYPNSVRSLAQTTTSQTILKHVGSKCRFCPPHIRNAVQDLTQQQAAREGASGGASTTSGGSSSSSRPRYGSRKIFFQRVWTRLHGDPSAVKEDDDDSTKQTAPDDISQQTPSDLDEESSSLGSSELVDHHFDFGKNKRKSRFGSLPMSGKRVKVTSPVHRLVADWKCKQEETIVFIIMIYLRHTVQELFVAGENKNDRWMLHLSICLFGLIRFFTQFRRYVAFILYYLTSTL